MSAPRSRLDGLNAVFKTGIELGHKAIVMAGLPILFVAALSLTDSIASAQSGTAAITAANSATAATIVVLDGSNSMNGRLAGSREPKYVLARNAIRQALGAATPATRFGLAAFGSRRSRDCTDAAVLVKPDTNRTALLEALEEFEPGGFSPVALALRAAAEGFATGPGKRSLVLLLDDLASCRGEDPCETAKALHEKHPALTIHVVGLGLSAAETETMTCVAQTTGGKLFDTEDADKAGEAIAAAIKLANAAPPPPRAVRPPIAIKPAAPPPPPVPKGLTAAADVLLPGPNLFARLSANSPQIVQRVSWLVTRAGVPVTAPALANAIGPTLNLKLPAGSYAVEARAGLITRRKTITVNANTLANPTPIPFVLDAGMVSITAPLKAGGAFSPTTMLALYPVASPQGQPATSPLWVARTSAENLVVAAGSYRIMATDGLARSERTITVAAGEHKAIELALGAARLLLEATPPPAAADNDRASTMQFVVEEDDPSSPSARREIVRTASPRLELTLPAGAYRVTARNGMAETVQRIVLDAGTQTPRTIPLALASVRLVSRIGKSLPSGLNVAYRIERLDGAPRVITLRGQVEPIVNLIPGRYRVESRIGRQNAVAIGEAEVTAGARLALELNPKAGAYQLKLDNAVGLGFGEVFWQILDDNGRAVWRTSASQPLVALLAGRYTVKVKLRGRAFEVPLEAKAGESQVLEIKG